jgi:hypothetical protein
MCKHYNVAAEKVRFSKTINVTSATEYVNYINCVTLRVRLQHQTDLTPYSHTLQFSSGRLIPREGALLLKSASLALLSARFEGRSILDPQKPRKCTAARTIRLQR